MFAETRRRDLDRGNAQAELRSGWSEARPEDCRPRMVKSEGIRLELNLPVNKSPAFFVFRVELRPASCPNF